MFSVLKRKALKNELKVKTLSKSSRCKPIRL